MEKNIGVITEQGYPAGKFGFDPLKEVDQSHVKDDVIVKETKITSK